MAILGSKPEVNKELLRGYEHDTMHESAAAFLDLAQAAKQESGLDIFAQPRDFLTNSITKDELRNYFVQESYDENDPKYADPAVLREHLDNMSALFENDVDGFITESTNLGAYSPVIGMALPIHKNILMNAVYDQVMPKDVSRSPKFTLTMEIRTLVDTKGNKYDMFAEQNRIKGVIEDSVPSFDHVITALPEQEATDFIQEAISAGIPCDKNVANLSIRTEVLGVVVENVWVEPGEFYWDAAAKKEVVNSGVAAAHPVLFKIHAFFTPGYGDHTRQMHRAFMISFNKAAGRPCTAKGTLMGYLKDNNRMFLQAAPMNVKDLTTGVEAFDTTTHTISALVVHAVLDVSSAAFPTPKVEWSSTTDIFQIPEAPHVTVPITPEEVKDIQALYDVNQVTKLMSMVRLALIHWKDDSIRDRLDESYLAMPAQKQYKAAFDWTPPMNYTDLPVRWRNGQFMDRLETMVTEMLQELNDENMTIAIFGRPDLIRRIAPQQYQFQTASNIGPVQLDFTRTVVTAEHRVYNFISTQKMRNNNNFVVLLIPRNSMRITYKVIDYQMYLSNEIRDAKQTALPAFTAFERWLFLQYQPVQGRVHIFNPTGLRNNPEDDVKDWIGVNAMNDYTANVEQYASQVNAVIDKTTGNFKIPPIKVAP